MSAPHPHPHLNRWIVEPGKTPGLGVLDPASIDDAPGDKEITNAACDELVEQLRDLQIRLWAERSQSLLVVLQAMDAGGKDGTIRKVFTGVNPQGVHITSFKAPTSDELARDFLWRVHARVPAKGEIGVFNRSHYEDVLIARVDGLVAEPTWRRRYGFIRDWEEMLVSEGTTIVKLFLHISRDEQARRLQARLEDPTKRWKFEPADMDARSKWDDYQRAYEEAIAETATQQAPWYVIPSDRKWYRNWAVLKVLTSTLEMMDPQFPSS